MVGRCAGRVVCCAAGPPVCCAHGRRRDIRGFVCEIYGQHFRLPELGPIGTTGLANARDFQMPVASYEKRECKRAGGGGDGDAAFIVDQKFLGKVLRCRYAWSVFDVVGWWGNYIPYKFDIALFSPVGSVLKDHPDPSIFTLLTAPTDTPGTAACDFVVFAHRWIVMEGTFRYGAAGVWLTLLSFSVG
jgi:homogentisate 1,2-dioxygenase